MNRPLVSVCVPIYNGAEFLEACLTGISRQIFSDFEVLIVDDCSTDSSLEIAKTWAARDSRFSVHVNESNLGLVENWNRCVGLAKGEWIKFLFQDDLIEPECLTLMLAAGDSGGGFVACARAVLYQEPVDVSLQAWFEQHQKILESIYSNKPRLTPDEYSKAKLTALELNIVGEPSVTLIRRSLFHRFGFFDPLLVQLCDSEMWNRLGSNVGIDYLPEKLVTFRVHRTSATHANQSRHFRSATLDEIIELKSLCTSPRLARFRRYVQATGEWKPLKTRLMRRTNAAYEKAYAAKRAMPANNSLVDDITAVMSRLPGYQRGRFIYLLYVLRKILRGSRRQPQTQRRA